MKETEKKKNWFVKHKIITVAIAISVALVALGMAGGKSEENLSKNNVVVPTKTLAQIQEDALAKQKADAQAKAYKTKVMSMINQFEAEDKILDKHMPTSIYYDYKDDPIYVQMDKVYNDIGLLSPDAKPNAPLGVYDPNGTEYHEVGNEPTEYDTLLDSITNTMSEAIHDLVAPEDNQQKYPRVAEVQIAIKRAERDIEIARITLDKFASSSDTVAVETYFDMDHFGGADSEDVVLDNLTQALMASDASASN